MDKDSQVVCPVCKKAFADRHGLSIHWAVTHGEHVPEPGRRARGRRIPAYHAAGHAVAGCMLHRSFHYATMSPGADGKGTVKFTKGPNLKHLRENYPTRFREMLEREIICHFAGQVADERFRKSLYPSRSLRGEERPRPAVQGAGMLSSICPSPEEQETYLNWLFVRTEQMMKDPLWWAAVEAIAAVLLRKRKIGYAEARAIILHALEQPEGQSPVPDQSVS